MLLNNKILPRKLVQAFISSDIPLVKLNYQTIQKLFCDLRQKVPSETQCRLNVKELSETNNRKLAEDLSEKSLYFFMDEIKL